MLAIHGQALRNNCYVSAGWRSAVRLLLTRGLSPIPLEGNAGQPRRNSLLQPHLRLQAVGKRLEDRASSRRSTGTGGRLVNYRISAFKNFVSSSRLSHTAPWSLFADQSNT
jgi:hypothetical protein